MFSLLHLQETEKKLPALIIYDADPRTVGHFFSSDALPDAVRMSRDLEWYRKTGSLPLVTFIGPCCSKNEPIVFTGGLETKGSAFFIKTSVGTWNVNFTPYDQDNRKLTKLSRTPGSPKSGPVLTLNSDKDVGISWNIPLYPKNDIRRHACQGWMAGLALRHCVTTNALTRAIMTLDVDPRSGTEYDDITSNSWSSFFWVWYPSAKPRNLRSWLAYLWKDRLSPSEKEEIWGVLHPSKAGFYLASVKKSELEHDYKISFCGKKEVMVHAIKQECMGDTGLGINVDLKICSPRDKHSGLNDWGFNGRTEVVKLYTLGNWIESPSRFGPVRSRRTSKSSAAWITRVIEERSYDAPLIASLVRQSKENEVEIVRSFATSDDSGDDRSEPTRVSKRKRLQ